jgi:hypothetical protein
LSASQSPWRSSLSGLDASALAAHCPRIADDDL